LRTAVWIGDARDTRPNSDIGNEFCCDAQRGTPYNDVVGCDPRTERST
jgi:hypothetical protein